MTEAEGLHTPTLVANCVFNGFLYVLHRHRFKYYNNTSPQKNVVVAKDFKNIATKPVYF